MDTETNPTPELSSTPDSGRARRRRGSAGCVGACVALVVIVVGYLIFGRGGGGATKYVTQEVTRGDLTVTVTATGNLEPRQPGRYRQRAVGHDPQRRGGCERHSEGGPGADEAGHLAPGSAGAAGAELARFRPGARAAECRRAEGSPSELRAAAEGARAERQQAALAAGHGCRRVRGGAGRGRGGSGACSRGAGASEPGCSQDGPQQDRHPLADQRHRAGALGRAGPDGRRIAAGAGAVHAGRRPQEDGAARGRRRGGHRLRGSSARARRSRSMHFPNRQFHAKITRVDFASNNTQKSTSSSSQRAGRCEQRDLDRRRDVRDGARSGQFRPAAAAGHDCDSRDRDHEHPGRNARAERRAALYADGCRRAWCSRPRRLQRGALSALMPTMPRRFFGSASNAAADAWVASGCSKTASLRWRCSSRAQPMAA